MPRNDQIPSSSRVDSVLSRLRQLLVVLLVAVGVSVLAGCGSPNSAAQQSEVGVEAFQERLTTDGVVVLDVRTPAEFAAGHLPDAINIDIEGPDFAEQIASLDKGAPYAIYCRSGNRSGVALDQMKEAGFTDLQHLGGGIIAWEEAGGDIVTQ